jgi:hypothetical protein
MKCFKYIAVFIFSFFVFSGSVFAGHCGGSHSTSTAVKSGTASLAPDTEADDAVIEAAEGADLKEDEKSEKPQAKEA